MPIPLLSVPFAWVDPGLAVLAKSLIKPLGHHELLLVLVQLALLLLVARGLGEVLRRFNQPPVIGELLAGVFLGPSLFGWLFPQAQAYIFPPNQVQSDLLSVISWLGVLFLLVVTGLETDLNLIVRKGKTALLISLGGIIVPFTTGLGLGWLLPDSFLANPSARLVFSLFIATAMSISAIPVIAKVLIDMNLIRRDIGQVILAAGMTDDTIGWILLSVVAGLATSGSFSLINLLGAIAAALLFLGFALSLGRPVMDWMLRWVDDHIGGATASLTAVLVLALGAAALTHSLGLEAALGAFVTGILAGRSPRFNRQAGLALELTTAGFLAPIFFASAGLKVNLLQVLNPTTLLTGLVVLAIACLGKFTGAYGGARLGGLSHWEGLALGAGMNARGAMEIIVATIGLSLGVLNPQMYSIIVMVAIVTSVMSPPLLRWTLSHVAIGEEEAQRLAAEAFSSQSFVKRLRRILIPTRGGTNVQLATQLVSHLAHRVVVDITAVFVLREKSSATHTKNFQTDLALNAVAQELHLPAGRSLKTKVLWGQDTSSTILQEAQKGYDLIVLGATEPQPPRGMLFNWLVDRIIQESPCATLVVKSNLPPTENQDEFLAMQRISHILVPTSGTEYSTYAVEIASTIAAQTGATVTLLHVIDQPPMEYTVFEENTYDTVMEIAQKIVHQQALLGRNLGAEMKTCVLVGNPEQKILSFAESEAVDLLVMGSNIRQISGRVFFGHRVDAILNKATCPIALVSPAGQG